MKKIDIRQEPFTTSNAILAYCLHLAGVPWARDNHPARVFYSPAILNKFTNGSGEPYYKGWELEKAVEHAHRTGKRGHVEYVFKHTDRLETLLNAFKKQVDEINQGTGYLHELVAKLPVREIAPDVIILRQACIFLVMRTQFMDIWKAQVPIVIIPNPGKVRESTQMVDTKHGMREARVVETPGFRAISLNASKETREHLGLASE